MHDVPALAAVVPLVVLVFHAACSLRHTDNNHFTPPWMKKSNSASISAIRITTAATTQVVRVASSRDGQTTLRTSKRASERNSTVRARLWLVRNTTIASARPATTASTRTGVGHAPWNQ